MEKSQWFIDWTDEMGFGIPAMDAADQQLFTHVNAFNEAIADARPGLVIRKAFDKVVHESSIHFRSEEQIFVQVGYPMQKGHAALHEQMRAELDRVKEELRRTEIKATWIECGLLVKQLFFEHTRREAAICRGLPLAYHRRSVHRGSKAP